MALQIRICYFILIFNYLIDETRSDVLNVTPGTLMTKFPRKYSLLQNAEKMRLFILA